ncbi:MAG: VTT domain-containing protein [bacterium]|nr:VTT domain-containing protein [bacterium]
MPDLNLASIIQFVGYPGLFTAVFLESGVFFGFFLPGASMLFTAGLLASQGIFNVWILIPLLTLAAILGDNTGYWFGAKVGYRLFLRPDSRFFRQEHLKRAKEFYDRHGFLAIVLARFIPIIRTFAPIVAGVVRMRYRVFVVYNIVGALLWASGVTFLGFYLGQKIPGIETYLTPIISVIIIVTCIPLVREYFRKRKEPNSSV